VLRLYNNASLTVVLATADSSFVNRGVCFYVSSVFSKRTYGQIDGFRTKRSTFSGNRAVVTSKTSFIGCILTFLCGFFFFFFFAFDVLFVLVDLLYFMFTREQTA
jgi:hypothetical protein